VTSRTVRWSDWSGGAIEHLVLAFGSDVIVADSVVISGAPDVFAARYQVVCDLAWRVMRVEVEVLGNPRRLRLESDGQGHWVDGDRAPLPDLDGAIDIDLSISPFTNTLPVRRLDLHAGQSADIVTAYIGVPELSVVPDPQRYTCLERGIRYRYESRDSDFTREIETDLDGLVVTYPGLFRRLY
jgi:uncharacterized protein